MKLLWFKWPAVFDKIWNCRSRDHIYLRDQVNCKNCCYPNRKGLKWRPPFFCFVLKKISSNCMVSDQFRWNVFVFGTNFVCCIPAYWLPPERNKWSGDGRRPLWAEGELLDLMNGRMCAQIVLKYLGKISLICDGWKRKLEDIFHLKDANRRTKRLIVRPPIFSVSL